MLSQEMLVNIKLEIGDRKDLSLIVVSATKNVPSAISSALRGALNVMLRDILKPTYFTARGVASALRSAGGKQ